MFWKLKNDRWQGYDRIAHKVQRGAIAPNGTQLETVADGVPVLLFLCIKLLTECAQPPWKAS